MDEEKCDVPVLFRMKQSERDALERGANGRSLAAVLRERLGLEFVAPGRRWPVNPAERQWRKTV